MSNLVLPQTSAYSEHSWALRCPPSCFLLLANLYSASPQQPKGNIMGQRKCICKQLKCCEYIIWKLKGIAVVSSNFFDGSKTSCLLRLSWRLKGSCISTQMPHITQSLCESDRWYGFGDVNIDQYCPAKTRQMLQWMPFRAVCARIRRAELVATGLKPEFPDSLDIW